jgi:septum formation protein
VKRLAEEKAQAVFARHAAQKSPGAPSLPASSARVGSTDAPWIVLGADTTVVCDGDILAKPADAEDAKRMLRRLSGRTHEVLTGVAVVTRAGAVSDVETTSVTFISIPEDELDSYCASGEPMDKAGAYGIQEYAARWIPRIDGCYFNVMGLPIARVVRMIDGALALVPR